MSDTPAVTAQQATRATLEFTGSGTEYFRIWVVNTLLTLTTLGIYSAWAKVRKARYFARNTRLLGEPFDFTANPWAILRGRITALGLVGFYTFAFDFSLTAGLVAAALLVVSGPWLFMSATRFRLRSTRWRGLRFAFESTTPRAYGAILVVVVLWVSSTVVVAFVTPERTMLLGAAVLPVVLVPWMHHRLKAFQHGHVRYGEHVSAFRPAVRRFYVMYVVSFLLAILAGIVFAALLAQLVPGDGTGWIAATLTVGCLYLGVWPYLATRLQAIVWGHTTLGPVRFETSIAARRAWPLAAKNVLGLVVTAGLYWPFASVAWARYRVECMSVLSEVPLDTLEARAMPASIATAGEGALDLFGIDLGW